MAKILVTGATGFLASHCIAQLLSAGHRVNATLRLPDRESEVRAMVGAEAGETAGRLILFEADLRGDAGWAEAAAGCDYAIHSASPFPAAQPRDEEELVGPARDGSLRVLRAARDAGVARTVVTSSFAAVGYGRDPEAHVFDESDWTDPAGADVQPYMRSKLLAERAVWDFAAAQSGGMAIGVINPMGIFGPLLGADFPASIGLVKALLEGQLPQAPRLFFYVVDVRDVADLHIRAMNHPAAAGERFLASSGAPLSLLEVARMLRDGLGARAARVPDEDMADAAVRAAPALADMAPQLGIVRRLTAEKADRLLGWRARSARDSVLASAESLIAQGLVAG